MDLKSEYLLVVVLQKKRNGIIKFVGTSQLFISILMSYLLVVATVMDALIILRTLQ